MLFPFCSFWVCLMFDGLVKSDAVDFPLLTTKER